MARIPALSNWMRSYVKWVVEFGADWAGLLLVCEYFLQHPRPGLYIRQLPIAIHTKFIQEHQEVLTSMLSAILPEASKNREGQSFEEQFGLRPIENIVRFRALDPALCQKFNLTQARMGLPLDCFRRLPAAGLRVIITENLMNLECLPEIPNCLGIWGQGNAAEQLVGVDWLAQCEVLYWGDIDEHGFHILARLRSHYPNLRSLMMDFQTFDQFRELGGPGEKAGAIPANLTAEERKAYEEVAARVYRLEQEKISPQYSTQAIALVFNTHGSGF